MAEKHTKKEDEEIAIDFSKIKDWFKKRKQTEERPKHEPAGEKAEHARPEHESEATAHEHHPKTTHHTHHKEKKETEEGQEELKLNYKDTIDFFKRYSTIFLILIPIILTIYLRLQPMYLPMTDDWAQNAVYNFYRNQIIDQINQQYPNLPDANKQALVDSEFQRILNENRGIIQQQVDTTSQQFKDKMMYESGNSKYVYLGDIDSYYWLRDARKYLQNRTMCDEIDYAQGLCYMDTYTMAPIKGGSPMKQSGIGNNGKLYSYVIAYTYNILKVFSPDMTIMQASFYVPLIFGIISAILAFLIGKAVAGNVAGLVTSIFITVNPIHLSRTMGSDNDPLNMFFPLLIILFFICTFKTPDFKKKILFGVLTGLSVSFFAAAWQGWWFMFNFIFAALIVYAGFYLVRQIIHQKKIGLVIKNKETRDLLTVIASVLLSSALFITIISGFKVFLTFITGPLWFTQTKVAALATFWPNVLVTVAEFNPGSIDTIIAQMGGKLIFFVGLMGILFVMTSKEKIIREQKYLLGFGVLVYLVLVSSYGITLSQMTFMALLALPVVVGMIMLLKSKEEVDVKLAILLVIWFVATTYAAFKGVRFTLLMVSAFGVALGITISALYRIISRWVSSELKINDMITKTIVALLLLMILIAPARAGYNTATNYLPSVNDAWYESLINIRDNSHPDAIINSWWDFGHWFKYLADRRVTLDGSSQSGPPLHWLGKLMVTDDEDLSVGILRMLDCGSNTAFDELNKILNDTSKSVDILDELIIMDKAEAGQLLLDNGLTKKEATNVLKYTHCDPPEDFFITSEDMVGKAGVWAHFGSWDFNRAEMYTKVKGKTAEEARKILMNPEYNLTLEQADQYYYEIQTQSDNDWITPWPNYMSSVQPCERPNEQGLMFCNMAIANGQQIPFAVNLTNMVVMIPAKESYRPASIVYVTPDGTEEKKFEGNTLPLSIVLVPSGEAGYSALITHPYLANSMFTRLFYLGGHGLRHFDKFDDQRGVTGGRILVWKVDWEGTDSNIVYKALEASEALDEDGNETEKKTESASTDIVEGTETPEQPEEPNEE